MLEIFNVSDDCAIMAETRKLETMTAIACRRHTTIADIYWMQMKKPTTTKKNLIILVKGQTI